MRYGKKKTFHLATSFLCSLLLILPLNSYGVLYNLGPLYRSIRLLSFYSIGATAQATNTWVSQGTFGSGSGDGSFASISQIVLDTTNDLMYVADGTRVQKLVLSTGAFVGAIGKSSASGTCVSGKQTSWCTGGSFSIGNQDGEFYGANSIAIDVANDRMYVGDSYRIQKFILSTGAFVSAIGNSTAAGTCSAGAQSTWCTGGSFSTGSSDGMFNLIMGVAIDPADGYLYVLEEDNFRVQRFNLATGAFAGAIGKSTASGTCANGAQAGWCTGGTFSSGLFDGMFNTPRGMATDLTNGFLYIADAGNNSVQKFNLSTGAFVGAIGYSNIQGTCIAGPQTNWCAGGQFFQNNIDGAFAGPTSVAVDVANNRLYVGETVTARLQKFNLSTGAYIGTIGGSATNSGTCTQGAQAAWCTGGDFFMASGTAIGVFADVTSIAIDATGNRLYAVDNGNSRIQKFNLSVGSFIGALGGNLVKQTAWAQYSQKGQFIAATIEGAIGSQVSGIAADPTNDRLYVAEAYRVQKFVLSTGAYIGTIGNSTATGTCVAGKQNTWCTGGTFSFGTGDGMFGFTNGLALDATADRLYVSEGTRIQKFVASTGAYVGSIGRSTASGTCVLGKQNTWCTGGSFSSGASDGMFNGSGRMALDNTLDILLVTDLSNNRIQKFTLSTGAFVGAIGNSTASGTCLAGKQNTWCTGGTFSSGTSDGMFSSPRGIAIDTTNDFLFVSESNRVQKFVLSTGAFVGAIGNSTASGTCVAGKQNSWCTGGTFSSGYGDGFISAGSNIKVNVADNALYVIVTNNHHLQKFNLTTGAYIGSIGKSTASGTCVAGVQSKWCTGGSFNFGVEDGALASPIDLSFTSTHFYVLQAGRVQRVGY